MSKFIPDAAGEYDWDWAPAPLSYDSEFGEDIYDVTDIPRLKPVRTALYMTLELNGPVLKRSEF